MSYVDLTGFSIGCDPELFVKDRTTGRIISAHSLIPGDKKNPHPVLGGAIQVDGMAVEFNTNPLELQGMYNFSTNPFNRTSQPFSKGVLKVMGELKKNLGEGYSVQILPYHDFGEEYLSSQPAEATELGCDPDFNAYTGEQNVMPETAPTFRTTSGHIHIGWGKDIPIDHPDHLEMCRKVIKTLDARLGLLSVLLDPDPRRRALYGKAGAFRPKSYGVEWRTPSSFWLRNDMSRKWMCNEVINALVSLGTSYDSAEKGIFTRTTGSAQYSEELVQRVINEADTAWLIKVIKVAMKEQPSYVVQSRKYGTFFRLLSNVNPTAFKEIFNDA